MLRKHKRFRIGLRTIKTSVAVVLSMMIVELLGTTDSRLIFAMLGAMAAVQTTFRDSLESCLTQMTGVVIGAVIAVLLNFIKLPPLIATGIGIILVITLYNLFSIRFSPGLPCFIVVMICTTPNVEPIAYAAGRFWDTTIGLGVGMLINTLIFPYDNSRQIRVTAQSLDKELIYFLEQLFDGDDQIPDAEEMLRKTQDIERQLKLFSNQKLLLKLRRQKQQIESFKICERKAHELVARMEILSHVGRPGRLNEENRRELESCGAVIQDERVADDLQEIDIVTNYHIRQILAIRKELLEALDAI